MIIYLIMGKIKGTVTWLVRVGEVIGDIISPSLTYVGFCSLFTSAFKAAYISHLGIEQKDFHF